MFLIVFVTLVVSIIGLYAQVLSLQAAKVHNAQIGLMQTMMTWHGAATDLALAAPPGNASPTGCALTSGYIPGANLPPCDGGQLTGTNAATFLPAGYNLVSFTFESIVFQTPGASRYVMTYVHDTNSPSYTPAYGDGSQNLLLPTQNGTQIGYTLNDLREQFSRNAPIYLSYGTVTALGTLTVPANYTIDGTTYTSLSYTIPTSIPVNSLAILSVAQ